MSRVIMFVFAGRQANMELQLPFVRRILDEHPDVEYHVWNLCREEHDNAYVRSISGRGITVRSELYPGGSWNDVYRHYAESQYQGTVFIKLDDDVVFLETHRFDDFVDAIVNHPRAILSANVVNNGACTPLEPQLWQRFEKLGIPLLDVHESCAYATMAHTHFFNHSAELINQPVELIPTEDWLSINVVGFDYAMNERIAHNLDKPHPQLIAGRSFCRTNRLGDEGCMNTFKRIILRGFVAGHLTFGPQKPSAGQLTRWRGHYATLGKQYLSDERFNVRAVAPVEEPSGDEPRWDANNWRNRHADNDPEVGRYVN